MKQLSHDVRIVYIDNNDDVVQNCYNHQFQVQNPNTYASQSINLVETRSIDLPNLNYIYLSCQYPVRVTFNGTNDVICQHLSWVNAEESQDLRIENNDTTLLENNIQILYGTVEPLLIP